MFWDKASTLYEFFENIYNGKVNRTFCHEIGNMIAEGDVVLECACGTGMISRAIARNAGRLVATDFSEGMLAQAKRKCGAYGNIEFAKADIMDLPYPDGSFDKVVAGNVIHLLDDPQAALKELRRVCRPDGELIIPTYVNAGNGKIPTGLVRIFQKMGAGFMREFDFESYKAFFASAGYTNVEYFLAEGRMPCAVARVRLG